MEVVEYACGIAELTKGEFSDQVSTGVDLHSLPPAAGRVRGDHAVQLPDHGPDVDAPDRDRDREHVRAQAVRARPVASPTGSPSCTPRPGCRTACSTSCTATRSRSTRCSTTRTWPRSASSARRRSRSTSTSARRRNGKRVQALGGAKNHAVVMPDADLDFATNHLTAAGYGSAGPALHGDRVAVAVGDVADELVERLRAKALAIKVGPGLDPDSEMGPVITGAARDRIVDYIGRDERRRRRRRPRARDRGRRLLGRPDADRQRHARHERLHRRDLRPGARRRARRRRSTRRSS